MRVAVLGGGPAGAFAAERLASAGCDVILFDEKLAWEKPCGGGLTFKACRRYPFLLDNDVPKRFVKRSVLGAEGAGRAALNLREPLVIYSRIDLNRLLLKRAEEAGARIEQARVLAVTRNGAGWNVLTSAGSLEAGFCIAATGARNALRDFGTQLTPNEAMPAIGYYVPGEQEHIDLHFYPYLEGYLWVFPRRGHRSVGICGKGVPARELRPLLESYMREHGMDPRTGRLYGHLLPVLSVAGWRNNRIAGEGWLAVGDAGGMVDPLTGEGIYYALRSAELAAAALLDGAPESYSASLREDFIDDLEYASSISKRMFRGEFLHGPRSQRMVQFLRRSATYAEVMADLFDGTQSYRGLKPRLVASAKRIAWEVLLSPLVRRRDSV